MNPTGYDTLGALRRIVFDVLRTGYGDAAIVMGPSTDSTIRVEVPADPLTAARAAKALMSQLRRLVVEYVRESRGQGRSWPEIAHALQLAEEWSPEQAAFAYVAGEPGLGYPRPFARWRCRCCGTAVTDWGPDWSSHPGDRETGHAPDCDRHNNEIRAYLDQLEDE